ncbi:MAG TPA: M20/M25/M40 family metallo-hydrolase [Candidatus Acidoferrales bacterium]|nr:M20/M25/M40 family metallo-hydrolase [Candidatus Acidoferrales bacterium]
MANLQARADLALMNNLKSFQRWQPYILLIKPVKLFSVFGILMAMATVTARAATNPIDALAQDKRVVRALAWLSKNLDWVTQQQIAITEIPAPEFQESARAAYIAKLFTSSGLKVRTDSAGNVIGERAGSNSKDVILIVAHLDTVFSADTDVHVKTAGTRLEAPGVSDDGAGLAALVATARALEQSRVKTQMTIALAADVGEEGEGNLRGIRQLVDSYGARLRAVIALDGAGTDYTTTVGLASRRLEIQVTGPGGHSWSDFGAPNPITALARGIVEFSRMRVPSDPRTTFNFGMVEGGTSVNSIPAQASLKVDLRSESGDELAQLETDLRKTFSAAVDAEMAAAVPGSEKLNLKFSVIGVRPGGKLPDDSPLLAAIENADRYLGNRARLERSSTDANYPLSLGIPAIAIGGGGQGGGAHSLAEWYDPTGRELGLKRIFLTILAFAGVQS